MVGLTESGRLDAVGPLLEVLEDVEEEPTLRAFAAKSLGSLGRPDALERLLVIAERDRSNLKFPVIEAIGRLRDTRAVPPLVALLGDEDAGVRFAAVGALEWLDCPDAREALSRARKDPSWKVRLRARRASKRLSAT